MLRSNRTAWGWAAFGLLVTGCDARRDPTGGNGGVPPSAREFAADVGVEDQARLRAEVRAAFSGLPGASDVGFANLRRGSTGALCGELTAEDATEIGGGRPFVVPPGGSPMVSASPAIRLDDPADPFPDVYMRYCASIEELARLREQMERLVPPAPAEAPLDEPVPLPEDFAVEVPAEPVESLPPPRADDQSFFNAVVRAPRDAAPSE